MKLINISIVMLILTFTLMHQTTVLAEEKVTEQSVNYTEVIRQAEIIQRETNLLLQTLQSQQANTNVVGASALPPSISSIINDISENLRKLGALIDSAKALTDTTSQQVAETGETVRTSIADLTTEMNHQMAELNQHLTKLIDQLTETLNATQRSIDSLATTVQHIDTATTQTVRFIGSLGGQATLGYYASKNGWDSSADVVLWKRGARPAAQFSFVEVGAVNADNADLRKYRFLIGTNRGDFSFGTGYIEDGLGIDLGLNRFNDNNIMYRLSLYRLHELGLNAEIAYRLSLLRGTNVFVFGNDILQSSNDFGAGISYERRF